MSYYQTPIKSTTKRNNQNHSQDKPTDWICIVCNNLNFSFRKKCNRCKTQTRIQNQNQMATAYSSYYYNNPNYLTIPKVPLADLTNCHTPSENPSHNHSATPKNILKFNLSAYNSQSPQVLPQSQPLGYRFDILDNQYWDNINLQLTQQQNQIPNQTNQHGDENNNKQIRKLSNDYSLSQFGIQRCAENQENICNFIDVDMEIQHLISKILVDDN